MHYTDERQPLGPGYRAVRNSRTVAQKKLGTQRKTATQYGVGFMHGVKAEYARQKRKKMATEQKGDKLMQVAAEIKRLSFEQLRHLAKELCVANGNDNPDTGKIYGMCDAILTAAGKINPSGGIDLPPEEKKQGVRYAR